MNQGRASGAGLIQFLGKDHIMHNLPLSTNTRHCCFHTTELLLDTSPARRVRTDEARLDSNALASQSSKDYTGLEQEDQETQDSEAVTHKGERMTARRLSTEDLTDVYSNPTTFHSSPQAHKLLPKSVAAVRQQLQEHYRARRMPPLESSPWMPDSLDEIKVNICLLNAAKVKALCETAEQTKPVRKKLEMEKLSSRSVIHLEDVFENKKCDRILAKGIAGSGKTTAFTRKAPFEWAKPRQPDPFWQHIALFFKGHLADPDWWKARSLADVFGLSRFGLTSIEQSEVVRFVKSHSEQVLLVADGLDEADVDEDSFLWKVLTGRHEDLPRLKAIITSRPCDRVSRLSKENLFHRRLEVIGFTDKQVDRFIDDYFKKRKQIALELQAKLVRRDDLRLLARTPLFLTLLCRQFQLAMALPRAQTDVYRSAMLQMLQQSTARVGAEAPTNVLDELSPRLLQVAVENLCELAYNGVKEHRVVFTKSQLSSANCLGLVADLGFLSSTPGCLEYDQDRYFFLDHTMQEFLAAVHCVRECNQAAKKHTRSPTSTRVGGETNQQPEAFLAGLVDNLGLDSENAQFWVFVSGLLSGELCESLLGFIADKVKLAHGGYVPDLSRLLILLLRCHFEGVTNLQPEGSPAVSMVMKLVGLALEYTHVSVSDAQAAANALHHYGSLVETVSLFNAIMDDDSPSIIAAALQKCTRLKILNPGRASSAGVPHVLAQVIGQNKGSLRSLVVAVSDEDLPMIVPSIVKCTHLLSLTIGSRALTNTSTPAIAAICKQCSLKSFGLIGGIDDAGFAPVASAILDWSAELERLTLHWTDLGLPMLISTLTSLSCLSFFQLVGNPVGDDGFRQLTTLLRRTTTLQTLQLLDVGLTCQSMAELEKLLRDSPSLSRCTVGSKKSLFLQADQDTDDIPLMTSMTLKAKTSFGEAKIIDVLDYPITEELVFVTDRSQKLILNFFD